MGKSGSKQVSPVLASLYAVVAFLLEVGLLFAAALVAIAYIPLPTIAAVLIVVVPLLAIWALCFSPKAVLKLRLRTRLVAIHLIYLGGAYAMWLSIDHVFTDQSQVWAVAMLGLTGISALLILATGGYVVPHDRSASTPKTTNKMTATPPTRGRRAAR